MAFGIKFQINPRLFSRDPQDTELGRKIINNSIILIDEIGFEAFTFKKLAQRIESTEASVYRYFSNKHALLIYLLSWYWEWVNYLIEFNTHNITDPVRKLNIAIENIVEAYTDNDAIDYVNESILHRIVISEGSKAYHTKAVDNENQLGYFLSYKNVADRLAKIIDEVNPNFPYSHSLASNLFEMANNQIFFAQHLPRLTDIASKDLDYKEVEKMLKFFAFKLLEN
jgi:AcrR family transcriptional regulator